MKYTIEGFSQAKAVELSLDLADLLILRWFVDFSNTDHMVKMQVDNKIYFWIKYEGLLNELPILGITKDGLYRRLKRMVEKDVFEHTTIKKGGTYSMYRLGKAYEGLISSSTEGTESIPRGVRNQFREGTESIPDQNNNLLKKKSIKEDKESAEQSSTIPYLDIIQYLNAKAETKYKSSSKDNMKHIKARWKEGYRLEDFFSVIDIKVAEWKDSEKMAPYLRPKTLFGTNFESYLQQAKRSPKKKKFEAVSEPASRADRVKNEDGSAVVF